VREITDPMFPLEELTVSKMGKKTQRNLEVIRCLKEENIQIVSG